MTKLRIGLDIGSTTIKSVVIDKLGKIVYSSYERHFSQITAKTVEMLTTIKNMTKTQISALLYPVPPEWAWPRNAA